MPAPSAVAAADGALQTTVERLFKPFRLEGWFALGFVALLDQCAPLANGVGEAGFRAAVRQTPAPLRAQITETLLSRPMLAMAIAAVLLTVIVSVGTLVLWLTCRGRFMYLDDVATGRTDIRRPWREHAAHAASHFTWLLGAVLAALLLVLALFLPIAWAATAFARSGPRPGPLVALGLALPALLLVGLGGALFMTAMRDFVAPLQWYAGVSCGQAIRLFLGLLREYPGVFVVYLLLKIVFSVALVIAAIAACCVTCCAAAVPYLQQTILQPALYFERAWSLELLAQLGHEPPGAAPLPPSPIEPEPAVEPSPATPSEGAPPDAPA